MTPKTSIQVRIPLEDAEYLKHLGGPIQLQPSAALAYLIQFHKERSAALKQSPPQRHRVHQLDDEGEYSEDDLEVMHSIPPPVRRRGRPV